MYDGYVIIPNGRPTWAPLLAASSEQSHQPRTIILNRLWSNITAGRQKAPFIGELTAKGGLRG